MKKLIALFFIFALCDSTIDVTKAHGQTYDSIQLRIDGTSNWYYELFRNDLHSFRSQSIAPSPTAGYLLKSDGFKNYWSVASPDQIVNITGANGVTPSGTYPNFTIGLSSTVTAGTYNTVTVNAQGRVTAGINASASTVTRAVNATAFQISSTQNSRVSYTVTHTIGLTLVLTSGSSMAYLEISPNGSTGWVAISQSGYSDGVAVAVSLTKTQTGNVQGEVPAGYYARIRTVTSGGGTAAYTCGQETIY